MKYKATCDNCEGLGFYVDDNFEKIDCDDCQNTGERDLTDEELELDNADRQRKMERDECQPRS